MTPAAAFRELLEVLDRRSIPYLVGRSLASSVHGIARATRDIDVVVDIRMNQAGPLASALARNFYADADMIREAISAKRAFNIIHYASTYKFDMFPAQSDEYTRTQFERREPADFTVESEGVHFQVSSAEDSVLGKLLWYQSGGEISEQQWRDILGIFEIQGERLDREYLRKWAVWLGVDDLLTTV